MALSLLPLSLNAQEATPPPEVPTEMPTDIPPATPTFTETPTLTPTPTLSETPTPTSTETATHTPTATPLVIEATGEVMSEAVVEVTEEIITPSSITPSATGTTEYVSSLSHLRFSEMFEGGGNPFAQFYGAFWTLTTLGDTRGLNVNVSNRRTQVTAGYYGDVALQMRVWIQGDAGVRLHVRYSASGRYTAVLSALGQLELYRGEVLVGSAAAPASSGTWHTLRLEAVGGTVRVLLDSTVLIAFADASPLPEGALAFDGTNLEANPIVLDDIAVWTAPQRQASAGFSVLSSANYAAYFQTGNTMTWTAHAAFNLRTYHLDLSGAVGLPPLPSTSWQAIDPIWSPDGSRIAFQCNFLGTPPEDYQICVMNADGSGFERISLVSGAHFSPDWSPDGTKLVYRSDFSGLTQFTIHTLSTDVKTALNERGDFPDWAEDGWIYFSSYDLGVIARIQPETSAVQSVLSSGTHPDVHGTQMVYSGCVLDSQGLCLGQNILQTSTSGGSVTVLTNGNQHAYAGYPVWSPTGLHISFANYSAQSNSSSIYVINPSMTNQTGTLLFDNVSPSTSFDWAVTSALAQPPLATNTPQPTPTITPAPTVTPNPPPTSLSEYSVYAIDQNGITLSSSDTRFVSVFQGVSDVGKALSTVSSIANDPHGNLVFRRVMVGDTSYFTDDSTDMVIGFVFYQRSNANCETYNIPVGASYSTVVPAAIATAIQSNGNISGRTHQTIIGCDVDVNLTKFTVVHELGHIFAIRVTNSDFLTRVENTTTNTVLDKGFSCSGTIPGTQIPCPPTWTNAPLVVMGNVIRPGGSIWIRGPRGWGSANPPFPDFTDFQQHPPEYEDLFEARIETAADLFLNWVYRTIHPNGGRQSALDPGLPAPGTWEGFLNKSWHDSDPRWGSCTAGCNDPSRPGDARYTWTDDQIRAIFANKNW